ncbi:MAG: cell wall-active antibiotics response protein LiaF, partial [Candidatus Zixiibacteriota bacterium]
FILVGLGIILLLNQTFGVHLFTFFWPVVLIGLGLWLIYRRTRKDDPYRVGPDGAPFGTPPPPPPGGGSIRATFTVEGTETRAEASAQGATASASAGPSYTYHSGHAPEAPRMMGTKIKYSKFIGDMYVDCANITVQNVEVSIFVGDLQVDLRNAKLGPGLNRMIIGGFLGDVVVLVPKDMPVFTHCSGFIGDVDLLGRRTSGFGNNVDGQTAGYETAESKLYIAINSFIGDLRVYPV